MTRYRMLFLATCWFLLVNSGLNRAQDRAVVIPEMRVLLQNDRLRVQFHDVKVGEASAIHSHPAYVAYVFNSYNAKIVLPDGTEIQVARKAGDVFIARSEELSNLAFEAVDLQEPATSMGLTIQRSEAFGRSGGVGIAALRGVIDAAFSEEVLDNMLNSELVALDDSRSVVLRVVDHQLPAVRPLEEVTGEISVLLRLERAKEQVRLIGETIVAQIV